jgi:hypothetical protein
VLSDLPGLTVLTLARGSFNVVTPPAGSSRIRESIETEGSVAGKLAGRWTCLAGVCEKKRGERGPCCFPRAEGSRPAVLLGSSTLRGGDAPVRAFLMGDGCMTGSPLAWAEGRFEGIGVCGSPRVEALGPRGLPAVDKLDW